VHVISVMDKLENESTLGALAYLQKPVTKEALEGVFNHISLLIKRSVKNLLVVEDDEIQRNTLVELIEQSGGVATTAVGKGEEAIAELKGKHFDCMILDLGLPDISGHELLERLKSEVDLHSLPVVIYTSKDLTKEEEDYLRQFAETIITKDSGSADRLLSETTNVLQREPVRPSPEMGKPHASDDGDPLSGRKVLVVDDDVRNIFALASALESHHMQVLYAENGKEGIATLQQHPDVDLVLMDIMMPEMDGYETMRTIRAIPAFAQLPIIALTAKAMQGDREKCLAAGASDYIPKPVNMEHLLGLARVWLNSASPAPAST
jgi:CheY-like chemotaxis protein